MRFMIFMLLVFGLNTCVNAQWSPQSEAYLVGAQGYVKCYENGQQEAEAPEVITYNPSNVPGTYGSLGGAESATSQVTRTKAFKQASMTTTAKGIAKWVHVGAGSGVSWFPHIELNWEITNNGAVTNAPPPTLCANGYGSSCGVIRRDWKNNYGQNKQIAGILGFNAEYIKRKQIQVESGRGASIKLEFGDNWAEAKWNQATYKWNVTRRLRLSNGAWEAAQPITENISGPNLSWSKVGYTTIVPNGVCVTRVNMSELNGDPRDTATPAWRSKTFLDSWVCTQGTTGTEDERDETWKGIGRVTTGIVYTAP